MNRTQLPQSLDSEKGILGSMILSERVVASVVELLTESNFLLPAHRAIWRLLVGMWTERTPIDLVTLTQRAEDAGIIGSVGGGKYITELLTFTPTAANWREYAEIVREKSVARHAITVADSILEAAYDPACGRTISEAVQGALVSIAGMAESKSETKHIRDIMSRRIDYFENLARNGNKLEGISTGIPPLDKAIRGLRPGNMVVIAAATKVGKSALALSIAANVAQDGRPVGIFSLEMNEGEVADRLIAAESGVDLSAVTEGGFSTRALSGITRAIGAISKRNIYIRDESVMKPLHFRAAARRLVAQHGVKLILLDYLQLMTPESSGYNREREVAEASRTVKTTAAELGIPIIVMSQVNDKMQSRESRAIEQDANIFMLIEEDEGRHYLNIKYARDCAKTRIPITFRKDISRFEASMA